MEKNDFIKAGFAVVDSETNENKLLIFLKENYPNVIRDAEINIEELKAVLGLPIDEKVNGYGLNFLGRNYARAKYAQKTARELRLNSTLSKNIDTTENLILKGDNLDSLKILKNYYSSQVKCIYIDPPYNTTSDEFVYPDNFKKEELEVVGLANLSNEDIARMEFALDNPNNKKSHNGWLSFMYPRLLLARDLLKKDGVIFMSIDDNEQSNLKLLCDDIFGEENFIGNFIWRGGRRNAAKLISTSHEYMLCYCKNLNFVFENEINWKEKKRGLEAIYKKEREFLTEVEGDFNKASELLQKWYKDLKDDDPAKDNEHYKWIDKNGVYFASDISRGGGGGPKWEITNPKTGQIVKTPQRGWAYSKLDELEKDILNDLIHFNGDSVPCKKRYLKENEEQLVETVFYKDRRGSSKRLRTLLGGDYFDFPKDEEIIAEKIRSFTIDNDIILDFFAGSGTTGQAVMQLNAEDGGNRKFILCQIDEPIKEDKPAYQFCIDNNLSPVISSITIERLKRAGEKIAKDIEAENSKTGMFEEDRKQVPDIGFKVFDSVEAPKLKVDDKGQISITESETDALSRIYNMIFTVGLDTPVQVPEEVVKDCIYKIGNNYYITNSGQISSDDYSNAIKNGKVFIDGWTASINGTLQNYKEDVKVIF
jgi:adenine-specific DNA-methyltransferase